MAEGGSVRCDYVHNDGWGKHHSCWRETVSDSEYCFWHADKAGKSHERIAFLLTELDESEYTDRTIERFDGAILKGTTLDGSISFAGCNLTSADFEDASLRWDQYPGLEMPWAPYRDGGISTPEFSNADLRNADFSNADFPNTDFANADLRGATLDTTGLADADLAGANLQSATVSNGFLGWADLSNTTLAEADFTNARLPHAELGGAFAERVIFSGADLSSANLVGASLYGALLSEVRLDKETHFGQYAVYDSRSEQYPPQIPDDAKVRDYDPDERPKASWLYRQLKELHEDNSMPDRAASFHIKEMETTRKTARAESQWGTYSVHTINRVLTNHGESLPRLTVASGTIILTAALIYPFVGGISDGGTVYQFESVSEVLSATAPETFARSLYFSVITFTTIGYANVAPLQAGSRLLVGIESLLGALCIALFVYVLGRRAAR